MWLRERGEVEKSASGKLNSVCWCVYGWKRKGGREGGREREIAASRGKAERHTLRDLYMCNIYFTQV